MDLSAVEYKNSPFVWLTYRKPGNRKKFYHKTKVRKDAADRDRKVALAKNEFERGLIVAGSDQLNVTASDWGWVEPWLSQKYRSSQRTLTVYRAQWDSLTIFFHQAEVRSPAMLDREHCFDYSEWRTGQVKAKSGRKPSINTAIGELKLLGMIMDEAAERGFVAKNVCRKLKISRHEPDLKPEITVEQEQEIIDALRTAGSDWMLKSFIVGILTGLRFQDTRIAKHQVRWLDDEILIEKPKGGRKREFSIPIYDTMRPVLTEFRDSKRAFLWTRPAKETTPYGIAWRRFFDRLGMPEICFHCTRVTFITRGMRAGIPEPVMMRLVNHGSKTINRVYQRHSQADVRAFASKMPGQAAAAAIAGSPQGTRAA